MFPIFSTAMAVMLCMVDPELFGLDAGQRPSPWTAALLAAAPVGEGLILLVRWKRGVFGPKILRFLTTFYSHYTLAAFAVAVLFLDWGRLPEALGMADGFFVDKVMLIASYLALSNLCRFYRNRLARAAGIAGRFHSRIGLSLSFRGELTVVIPFMVFIFFSDLVSVDERVKSYFYHLPVLFWAGLLSLFMLLAFTLPWLIRVLWSLKPFPPDSLVHRELLQFMKERAFTAREILIWPTGHLLVNAAILGLTRRNRFIIFSDAMLEGLTIPELKAVLAHELGHGKRRHILTYFIFSTAFIFAISLLENVITPYTGLGENLELALILLCPVVLLYWWMIFGFISRRFEMEADLYGAEALGDPELFIATLDKVAWIGRVEKRRGSWRHFSIDRRIAFLREVFQESPGEKDVFCRKMQRIRRVLAALYLVVLFLFCGNLTVQSLGGAGLIALEGEQFDAAERYLETAAELPGGGIYSLYLIEVYLLSGQVERARSLIIEACRPESASPYEDVVRRLFMRLVEVHVEQKKKDTCMELLDLGQGLFSDHREIVELNSAVRLYFLGVTGPFQKLREKMGWRDENPLPEGSSF